MFMAIDGNTAKAGIIRVCFRGSVVLASCCALAEPLRQAGRPSALPLLQGEQVSTVLLLLITSSIMNTVVLEFVAAGVGPSYSSRNLV